ncbi:MAG: DUF58 domain-containing protein [Thermoplasmatota archaeon]
MSEARASRRAARPTLSPRGRALALASGLMLTLGTLFANPALLGVGALPALFLAASLARPPRIEATVALSEMRIARGASIEFQIRVKRPGARGSIEIHQPLPETFLLASPEESNFRVLAVGDPDVAELAVAFACTAGKRGEFAFEPMTARWIDPLGLVEHVPRAVACAPPLVVEARASHHAMPRGVHARAARALPDDDPGRVGLATTEFRETRDYSPGDPARSINWRATARRLARSPSEPPVVNEYEREGRKTAWLLIDAGVGLQIGDTLVDAREDTADAALGLAEAFLRRGYPVGVALFRGSPGTLVLPETGGAQRARLAALLSRATPAEGDDLVHTLDRASRVTRGRSPLYVIMTRLDADDTDVDRGLRRARALHGRRAPAPASLVVDVAPWSRYPVDGPSRVALADRRIASEHARRRAREAGALVVPWDAGAERFEVALARAGVA